MFYFFLAICKYGWQSHEVIGICYEKFDTAVTQQEARSTCRTYGATLPIIQTSHQNDFFTANGYKIIYLKKSME